MKLSQAEAFSMFNHHHGSIGDIHSHFNYRGLNQNLNLALLE